MIESLPALRRNGSDSAIRMITEGSSDFTQGSIEIIAHPGSIATTSELGTYMMDYEELADRIGLLEPIYAPRQGLIRRFQEEIIANKLEGIFHCPLESLSPEEAKHN